jgi:hypothetical protein
MSSSRHKESATVDKDYSNRFLRLVAEYDKLLILNEPELVFQRFFEKYPVFLDPTVQHSYPHMPFGAEKLPDFILENNCGYIIVEIEKPSVRLFTKSGEPTAFLTHAQHQIRGYLEWASLEGDYLARRLCKSVSASNVKGLIVIGRSDNLSEVEKRLLLTINCEVRSKYEIKTFDQLVANLQAIAKNLWLY